MRALMVVLVAVGGVGCATSNWAGGSSLAEERFPRREELQKVALREPKLDLAGRSAKVIDTWALKGPLPTTASVTRAKATTPWELAIAQDAAPFANAFSEDMQCIARETAHYYVARGEYPGNSLRAFIERRCGTTATQASLSGLSGEIPEGLDDAAWLAQWRADIVKKAQAVQGPVLSGISVVREGTKGVVMLAWGAPAAQLARPLQLVGTTGSVEIRGRLLNGSAERIGALVNKGELGVESCKTLDAVTPPEFVFSCPVDVADTRTTLAIAAFQAGRILGSEVATFTLWPSGKPADSWQRGEGNTEVPQGQFNAQFLAAVNRLRQRAGLPMLMEAKAQSATAAQLAPHYFETYFGKGDPLDSDRIALGMMAGWDVGADIVSSGFGNTVLLGSRDLSVFMDFALDDPFQRKALTDPRATLFSIGSVDTADNALAAIFATYVPMGAFDRKEAEAAIITRLNQLRLDRKLGLAQWTLWPQDEGAMVEAKLKARAWTPQQASRHVLEQTAAVAKGEVISYVQLVDDLDNFQFPPEVLMRSDINVFLAVATYRDEDWAQTRYVVCFVLARTGDIETASR